MSRDIKADKCLGVGYLGRQELKTRRSTKIVLVINVDRNWRQEAQKIILVFHVNINWSQEGQKSMKAIFMST
jgi:hypothetical protein